MKILATGDTIRFEELKQKLSAHELVFYKDSEEFEAKKEGTELVIDLNFNADFHRLGVIKNSCLPMIVSVATTSLIKISYSFKDATQIYGLCCLPTFINRPLWEMSILHESDREPLEKLAASLGVEVKIVSDRVGMATPRVICMIINEAYFTVQEGTASKADIDTAMKLGTNYPHGPFEWCEKIGIGNVYELLNCMYDDTHDERYKICPLLKTEYLKSSASQALFSNDEIPL
ncbi:MAG: 3-hydroxyacyl-CoA dehydrogenase [Flavobacteriaceae bacterium]|nr:3-hydroxyacyl-CoA dehydrogenase [Flavobacteriaceae bacterium]